MWNGSRDPKINAFKQHKLVMKFASVGIAVLSILFGLFLQYKNYDRRYIVPESVTFIDNMFYDNTVEWWDINSGSLRGLVYYVLKILQGCMALLLLE